MEKIDFNDCYLMGEDIPTCPTCGARTEIILDMSHIQESTQVHKCLMFNCKMEFVLISDSDFFEN